MSHDSNEIPDTKTAGRLVYLVDDDFDVLKSLRFLLETEGYDVRIFRSGHALLSSEVRNAADCLVIDYKMPELNGIDLTRKLRELKIETPVVLFTGYPDDSLSSKAHAVGIKHFLLKPHLEESLLNQVKLALQEGNCQC
jgi:FixJ family two-component response regulator